MHILCIGDGDFSFSLALARALLFDHQMKDKEGKAQGLTRIVTTSYESLNTLLLVYPSDVLEETIREMQRLGVSIAYNVDATRLRETMPSHLYNEKEYHRIIWNFPCTAESDGQDGQNDQMEQNKYLVRQFMAGASHLLHPTCGEIHMAHKTKPPFDQWKIECVATQFWRESSNDDGVSSMDWITEGVRSNTVVYSGRIVFDRCCFPPYTPRKARHKKSFTYHDACIYIFSWMARVEDTCIQDNLESCFPPTIPRHSVNAEDEGSKQSESSGLLLVTEEMIEQIRSVHLMNRSRVEQERKRKKQRVRSDKIH